MSYGNREIGSNLSSRQMWGKKGLETLHSLSEAKSCQRLKPTSAYSTRDRPRYQEISLIFSAAPWPPAEASCPPCGQVTKGLWSPATETEAGGRGWWWYIHWFRNVLIYRTGHTSQCCPSSAKTLTPCVCDSRWPPWWVNFTPMVLPSAPHPGAHGIPAGTSLDHAPPRPQTGRSNRTMASHYGGGGDTVSWKNTCKHVVEMSPSMKWLIGYTKILNHDRMFWVWGKGQKRRRVGNGATFQIKRVVLFFFLLKCPFSLSIFFMWLHYYPVP